MLREALTLHAETLEALEGETFVYFRASGDIEVELTGILDQTRPDEETGFRGPIVSARLLDVLVRPKWFIDNEELGEPKPGDTLESSDGRRFEVHSQSAQPCFIWSDPRHTFYRIHLLELKPTS
jgi:hypothetical protein